MRLRFIFVVLLMSLVVNLPMVTMAEEPQENLIKLSRDNSEFATRLYREICAPDANLIFSPYSVSSALAMTYAGARGTTESQMAAVLSFSLDQKDIHQAFADLGTRLDKIQQTGDITLNIANSLWPETSFELLSEYVDLIKKNYGVEITPLEFRKSSEAARTINRWVENKTHDKIRNIISARDLGPLTRLVLANAIYFNGKWLNPFDPSKTREAPFYSKPDNPVKAQMMTQKSRFRYLELEDLQILEMPYLGNNLSMVALLPRKMEGLSSLESQLGVEQLEQWRHKLIPTNVTVYFPRFQITHSVDLGNRLVSMGMVDAFSDTKADFSGIAVIKPSEPLYISRVLHKAFIKVSEEGTEAAAATAVIQKVGAAPRPTPIFRADHPFIFMILENQTGSVLFMGKMTNPDVDH